MKADLAMIDRVKQAIDKALEAANAAAERFRVGLLVRLHNAG